MIRRTHSRDAGGNARPKSSTAARFRRAAQLCRARDLRQLFILGELVTNISILIHALQKERGAASIFLSFSGASFIDALATHVSESRALQAAVEARLDCLDGQLDPLSAGARLYTRIASVLQALDALPALRRRILALEPAAQEVVRAYSDLIARLLAVGVEAAHLAADPATSRALVALVSFSQGKEFAGQERATGGVALAGNRPNAQIRQQLQRLIDAQEHAFRVFAQFADAQAIVCFGQLSEQLEAHTLRGLRGIAMNAVASNEDAQATANRWFEVTTRRIDAMKRIEDDLARTLERICEAKLVEVQTVGTSTELTVPPALLITEVVPGALTRALDPGIGLYGIGGALPTPMRPILEVLEAQSRQIADVTRQLESTRMALAQRTVIERARSLLMKSRGLSESEAYALLRRTAMNQNRRLAEVAESIVGLADILEH